MCITLKTSIERQKWQKRRLDMRTSDSLHTFKAREVSPITGSYRGSLLRREIWAPFWGIWFWRPQMAAVCTPNTERPQIRLVIVIRFNIFSIISLSEFSSIFPQICAQPWPVPNDSTEDWQDWGRPWSKKSKPKNLEYPSSLGHPVRVLKLDRFTVINQAP